MSIRFSVEGPAFPEELVNDLLNGDVIFLCGAGVSAPQLPTFAALVERCFEHVNMTMSPAESESFKAFRYEEVLGSLSRRIAKSDDMTQAVVQMLRTPADPDLSHHRTILRLSRDRENRPTLVTTNFDTLLERALLETHSVQQVRALSAAGQDLPSPGSASFAGIIHLHGRLADAEAELEQTPIVITSADYGDAYMRSGWASRFLFDLCRCKTVVLIGYRAGDAPVRYFLNVLDADRQRFPELRRVYALDGVKVRTDTEKSWGVLAVEPIAYEVHGGSHDALWRDLTQLADMVEQPARSRRAVASEILSKPCAIADAMALDRVSWLYRGSPDLWSEFITTVKDAAWLDFFEEHKLWSQADASWIVAAWIGRDFQSPDRLEVALKWRERLGEQFARNLARQLRLSRDLAEVWLRAWRLVCTENYVGEKDWEDGAFMAGQALEGAVVLAFDVQKALQLLTPTLTLEPSGRAFDGKPATGAPKQLRDLLRPRLRVRDLGGAPTLLEALIKVPQPLNIIILATSHLREVINISVDAEMIDGDYDPNDYAVPSVAPHRQNEHHDGVIYLVQLIAQMMPAATAENPSIVRGLAELWRNLPGVLGARIWLHALSNPAVFTADEALRGAGEVSLSAFWSSRPELPVLLRERAGQASAELVTLLERRICDEGEAYYSQFTVGSGETDWRSHARDAGVWLRLNMIAAAGRLSEAGEAELAAIKDRNEHLNREVEDSDYFGSYSTGVRMVVGNPQPIIDAAPDERLQVAHAVLRGSDLEMRQGWSAYCQSDPLGAFKTLADASFQASNAPLWNSLIEALSFPKDEQDPDRLEVIQTIFETLKEAGFPFLALLVRGLTDLYRSVPQRTTPAMTAWWSRLFDCAAEHDHEPVEARDLHNRAINSTAGRLTEAALLDIESSLNTATAINQEMLDNVARASAADGRQGAYARAVLVFFINFLVRIDAKPTLGQLHASLGKDTEEAGELRSILISQTRLSPDASRVFRDRMLQAASELGGVRDNARNAAGNIIRPALAIVRNESNAAQWGITVADAAQALRTGPASLREGTAVLLKEWISQIEGGPATAWRTAVYPLLAAIWPRERVLQDHKQASYFASLAIACGEAFPEALDWLLPYLLAEDAHVDTYVIEQSHAPEKFPQDTLKLLWRMFGHVPRIASTELPKILNRLIAVDPPIELDRRLQWLYQRTLR